MKKRREATPKYLAVMSIIWGMLVIIQSAQVMYTPYPFVRVINLIAIIFLSAAIGAFVREIFVLKNKEKI
ncbi:hypothetical protein [Sporosarcina sp. FSL K6-2383]|uniref:hypothetical protein n=1 Tax=Sporosarcina sp. FSL K6-2383 TaxID=2921556 RepID=UPI00315ADE5B